MSRSINNPKFDDYSLLAEIATVLNVSVSYIESYPADIRKMLRDIYIDNFDSDIKTKRSALTQVINLSFDEKGITPKPKPPPKNNEQQAKTDAEKYRANAVLTREIIARNAALIAQANQQFQMYDRELGQFGNNNNNENGGT